MNEEREALELDASEREALEREALERARPATTVDVGAVVWGFAFLAVAAVVGVRAATGVSWPWGWNVAGVLLLGGLATVLAAAAAAARGTSRRR
ncbi:hypothetical protein [Kineococcus indalonis]|uniref:hypothetical protein n=1 Tax=Kineococcus indalonis TaxID=2696566 RepID=UPI001413765E|nr:hypothetical protein [Kineococcus indalonis]NAZ87145.1 hypothetical protein [Kineococcus indalonis]